MFVGVALAGGERARGYLSLTISLVDKIQVLYKYMKYNVIKLEDRYPLCESLDPNKPWCIEITRKERGLLEGTRKQGGEGQENIKNGIFLAINK